MKNAERNILLTNKYRNMKQNKIFALIMIIMTIIINWIPKNYFQYYEICCLIALISVGLLVFLTPQKTPLRLAALFGFTTILFVLFITLLI
jgi:hypothetical protein